MAGPPCAPSPGVRFDHPALPLGLPVAGFAVGLADHWLGRSVEAGNNVIADRPHKPGDGVPPRTAFLIVVSTVVVHRFGGSAGREGTAVLPGSSLTSALDRLFRLSPGRHARAADGGPAGRSHRMRLVFTISSAQHVSMRV